MDLILCHREARFDRLQWRRVAEKVNLAGPRSRHIAVRRYVDDLVAVSFQFCDGCLQNFGTIFYQCLIIFDRDLDATQALGQTVKVIF